MERRKGLLALVVLGLLGVPAYYYVDIPDNSVGGSSPNTTKLIIEMSGGFAIVPTDDEHRLEIAYLDDVKLTEAVDTTGDGVVDIPDKVVCEVQQVGTELQVIRGEIIDADPNPAPEDRIFNLDEAVVTIPALDTANIPLTYKRTKWAPNPMVTAPPKDETQYHDLQFVPSIKDHHGQTSIATGWRDLVNGRLVLRGGDLKGTIPSDTIAHETVFEFKKAGATLGRVSTTDKIIYTVDVPGDAVELVFDKSKRGYKRVKIAPARPHQPVKLRLRGLHAMGNSMAHLVDRQPLTDFCAFYSLLEPRPSSAEWVTVHYVAPQRYGGFGAPSPGYFCDPSFF